MLSAKSGAGLNSKPRALPRADHRLMQESVLTGPTHVAETNAPLPLVLHSLSQKTSQSQMAEPSNFTVTLAAAQEHEHDVHRSGLPPHVERPSAPASITTSTRLVLMRRRIRHGRV